ncbi:MAG: hypothetical protein P8H31_08095 [Porticoccaceae bacterium]|nr:hypothetical protein [Porticoccaceae bacterium]
MKKKSIFLCLTLLGTSMASTSELTIPNQFSDGQVTSASQMNENFESVRSAVNAINSQINSSSNSEASYSTVSRSVFVGFSQGKVNGGQGIFAMQQKCATVVVGSHVCTINEIITSPYNANIYSSLPEEGKAWTLDASDTGEVYKFQSCSDWSLSSSPFGSRRAITNLGFVVEGSCSEELHVACCK